MHKVSYKLLELRYIFYIFTTSSHKCHDDFNVIFIWFAFPLYKQ